MVLELKLIQLEKISFAIGIAAFIILIKAANKEIEQIVNREQKETEENFAEEEEESSTKKEESSDEKEALELAVAGNKLLLLERLISAIVATIRFKEEKNKLKYEADIKTLTLNYRIAIGLWIVVLGTILVTTALQEM